MCGIVGTTKRGVIKTMLERVQHRGPDGSITHEGVIGFDLGFARLSITGKDQKATIMQQDGDWLLFNGEIFGYPPEFDTDTEYLFSILRKCNIWDSVNRLHLHGQYAFAFWNNRQNRLVLGRDFFGERPLYYYQDDTDFYFASETKALLPFIKDHEVDYTNIGFLETCVMDLANAPNSSPDFQNGSMVRNVKQVPANHVLVFTRTSAGMGSPRAIEIHSKWQPALGPGSISDLVYNSIVERSDHGNQAVGAYLSGGLDSALICCIARPKHVFTCVFDTPMGKREYEFAAKVAKRIGAVHHVVRPQVTREAVAQTVYYTDGPQATLSPVADFALAKEAAKYVKAVLTGQGADELFCGYFRDLLFYTDMMVRLRYKQYGPLMDHYHGGSILSPNLKWDYEIMSASFLHLLARGPIPDSIKQISQALALSSFSPLQFAIRMEIAFTLPSLVQMNDRAAAHAGIESRSPFLDDELYQAAIHLPDEQRITFNGQRWVTKRALRDLARGIVPDEIIDCEEKTGLFVPMGELFPVDPSNLRGEFSRSGYADFCQNTWRVIVESFKPEVSDVF